MGLGPQTLGVSAQRASDGPSFSVEWLTSTVGGGGQGGSGEAGDLPHLGAEKRCWATLTPRLWAASDGCDEAERGLCLFTACCGQGSISTQ